jgi:hypothetical protein
VAYCSSFLEYFFNDMHTYLLSFDACLKTWTPFPLAEFEPEVFCSVGGRYEHYTIPTQDRHKSLVFLSYGHVCRYLHTNSLCLTRLCMWWRGSKIVARWYIYLHTKPTNFGIFWKAKKSKLLTSFMAICGSFLYFTTIAVICNVFSCFVVLYHEKSVNLDMSWLE